MGITLNHVTKLTSTGLSYQRMKPIIILFLIFSLPAFGQVAQMPGHYDYLSVDLGGTYSWLTGYENFFWPIVYPYDSRSNPPAQYVDFTRQGSGLGFKTGLGLDMRIAGTFALRLGLFYRTQSTGNTEQRISEPTPRLSGSPLPEIERTYTSTWQFTGAEILGRIPLFSDYLYGLAGVSLSYMLGDKFDLQEHITDDGYQGSYNDLPSSTPSGKRSYSVTDQISNNYYDLIQFGAKLGLGYFIPISESIVLTPEVTTTIPFGKLTSSDVEPVYLTNGAQTPRLSYIEFQLGVKFVIGEEKRVYETPSASSTTLIPRSETSSVVMKPTSFAELRGRVRNRSTNSPLQANLTITDLDTDSSWSASTTITGDYRIPVTHEGRYSITAETREHIFSTTLYTVSSEGKTEPSTVDIQLFKEQGTQRLLVFYQTDKYELQKESNTELERLVRFMKEIPNAIVEISGHTDSQGDDDYNKKLSERRANAVVEYLAKRGIAPDRLKSTGFGETKSVSTNTTEEGRANNRRVEMTVRKK